ncbi:hypothetical protein Dacet_0790 [Denitrovibrio acetiphilus DSM 12809]|uniref:Tetratricopeptide repeat protein n=1 Tax=Denitrovibrio acetiphilus (strain DSM 12809 / NBRC 114555 / N2460) TaxID=522772 RepID=D4H5F0_DENA2|nr:hypothetical protein [Denitrovibrio acetiphilus]ADD67570.1 hypothetical protein Dacet_0790 [Denitrovibrio acetiphilus DSM 12809]
MRILRGCLLVAGLIAISALGYAEIKPVFDDAVKPAEKSAVLYFDIDGRYDLNIMTEFLKYCTEQTDVTCICAEASGAGVQKIKGAFEGNKNERYIYRSDAREDTPEIVFSRSGEALGVLKKESDFAALIPIYLDYTAGRIDAEDFAETMEAIESAEMYKKIVPRMNFVLLLAKKGERDAALAELDKIETEKLDDKGRLLLGETFLRLKAPKRAHRILKTCGDVQCRFYAGVSEYMAGDPDSALETLENLKGVYPDENRLKHYIKSIYESKGDKERADAIQLPDNYNIDAH